jgi:hypothetical protein
MKHIPRYALCDRSMVTVSLIFASLFIRD